MKPVIGFWKFFVLSLLIAAASAGIPYFSETVRNDGALTFMVVLPLSLAWLIVVVVSFWRFQWRGLWLLLGTPIVLSWPIAYFMIAWGCARNTRGCP